METFKYTDVQKLYIMVDCKTCTTVIRLSQRVKTQQTQITNLTNELNHYKRLTREKNSNLNSIKYNVEKELSKLLGENKTMKLELEELRSIVPKSKQTAPITIGVSTRNYELLKLGNGHLL